MSISNLKEEIRRTSEKTAQIAKKAEEILKDSPEGEIHTYISGGKHRYFCRKQEKAIYLDEKHQDEIGKLEKKYYCKKLLKAAEAEKVILEKTQKLLEKCPDIDNVFIQIDRAKRHLIEPLKAECDEKLVETFTKYKSKSRVSETNYQTMNGEFVRSKSELIIADRLKANDIPYDYESGALMDDMLEIWHPDFAVLNKRTGKVLYWEHFGMLDNPDYCKSFQYKLERFAQKGIFTGENLIITTESSDHPLNTEYVETLIKHFLI